MANDTTACAAACVQGDGTAEETAAYASCQQACFSSLFFTGTAVTKPTASGSQFVGDVSATATDASHTGTGSMCLPTIPIFIKLHSIFTNLSTF
jgi:hypothetical protein